MSAHWTRQCRRLYTHTAFNPHSATPMYFISHFGVLWKIVCAYTECTLSCNTHLKPSNATAQGGYFIWTYKTGGKYMHECLMPFYVHSGTRSHWFPSHVWREILVGFCCVVSDISHYYVCKRTRDADNVLMLMRLYMWPSNEIYYMHGYHVARPFQYTNNSITCTHHTWVFASFFVVCAAHGGEPCNDLK